MRTAPFLVAAALAGCGSGSTQPPDAAGVRVTGCDDEAVWTAPALGEAHTYPHVGGGPCSPAQYPLHRAYIAWTGEFPPDIDRTCWRVVDASPASGWTAGQTFEGDQNGATINVKGFASSMTLEGRVLRDDGTIMRALAPASLELDKARILDAAASTTIAVVSPEVWAERDAVHLWGNRVATDEVLDASGFPFGFWTAPFTIHRTTSGLIRRAWASESDPPQFSDIPLGAGTRARIARYGVAVVVDTELLLVGGDGAGGSTVKRRIQLGAEPRELFGNYHYVTLHMDGMLVQHSNYMDTVRSMTVGDGVLLPTEGDSPPMFFDGTTFHRIDGTATALAFDDRSSFTPRAEYLAALGAPVAVLHGIVLGEHGLLAAAGVADMPPGPRFVSYAELTGASDARLGPIAADTSAYVVARPDGSAALYNAPYIDYCE